MHTYPRLLLLTASFALAYLLYHMGWLDWMDSLKGYGYLSIFIAGLLFSFGFTTPFAIAIFMEMSPYTHPLIAAPVAGLGALISDFLIFDLVRFSAFRDEIARLRSSYLVRKLHALIHHDSISDRVRHVFLWTLAGVILASPLPDEIGVSLVSGISRIQPKHFAIVCFCFNTIGVLIVLLAARAIL